MVLSRSVFQPKYELGYRTYLTYTKITLLNSILPLNDIKAAHRRTQAGKKKVIIIFCVRQGITNTLIAIILESQRGCFPEWNERSVITVFDELFCRH